MQFYTDDFKQYEKVLQKENEKVFATLYEGVANLYQVYDKASDIIAAWDENLGIYRTVINSDDNWTYGSTFKNKGMTDVALKTGDGLTELKNKVDQYTNEFIRKYPQIEEVKELAYTKKRRRVNRDDGNELNIERYLNNDSDCWEVMQKSDFMKKVARVYIGTSLMSGCRADQILNNGIALIALVNVLEAVGVSVEIVFGNVSEKHYNLPDGGMKGLCLLVPGKEANEPLDVARLLSFIIPGFTRFYCFNSRFNVAKYKSCISLGRTAGGDTQTEREAQKFIGCDIYTSIADSPDVEKILDKVKNLLGFEKQ